MQLLVAQEGKESACNEEAQGSILGSEAPGEGDPLSGRGGGLGPSLSLFSAQNQLPHEEEQAQRPGYRVLRGPTEMFSFLENQKKN